jgi:ubiquinone/menaquinone biosynthesis C-methylase UbiE
MEPKLNLFNAYARQLTADEIASGDHRRFVGGFWDVMGRLQCDFLIARGLRPEHKLFDVGCGALRGGVHFVKYLARGHYYGLDANASLIDAGRQEIESAGLSDREVHLLVNDKFELSQFKVQFDYGIAQSLFSHLCFNHIVSCLVQVKRVLATRGRLYATFFEAPRPVHLETIVHSPGGIHSMYDADPFHYSFEEMNIAAKFANLAIERVGDWGHPNNQKMLCFTHGRG